MNGYSRDDKTDLSGMTPDQVSSYLKPHYETDSDLSLENLGIPLWVIGTAVVLIGSVVFLAFALLF